MSTNVQSKYRILGVDPGTNILGYGIIEVYQKEMTLLDFGVLNISHTPTEDQAYKLKLIFDKIATLVKEYRASELSIEAPFYGKNPQSMLKLGRAQGVAIAAAITNGLSVTEYSPKKIKQSVTGNGNASKEQVAGMLEHILKTEITHKYLDATDALAAAVCHFYQSTSKLGGSSSFRGWGDFIKKNPNRLK